jgi:hypothetical protein
MTNATLLQTQVRDSKGGQPLLYEERVALVPSTKQLQLTSNTDPRMS